MSKSVIGFGEHILFCPQGFHSVLRCKHLPILEQPVSIPRFEQSKSIIPLCSARLHIFLGSKGSSSWPYARDIHIDLRLDDQFPLQ